MIKKRLRKTFFKYYYLIKRAIYKPYDSNEFSSYLDKVDIKLGDTVFVMCSANNIKRKSGREFNINVIINDILNHIGEEGNLVALCFSYKREELIKKEYNYNVHETATMNGVFSEILRRKDGSHRSVNPVFSVVAIGKDADYLTKEHHLSPYPFDLTSPFYKLLEKKAKYLGIGVGFEAFTPIHLLDDSLKENYIHKMYFPKPVEFKIINKNKKTQFVKTYVRRSFQKEKNSDIITYFNKLNINSLSIVTSFGISLFTIDINEFYSSAMLNYKQSYLTQWNTKSNRYNRYFNKQKLRYKDFF